MSYADIIFKRNLLEIMSQDWEVDNRAKWEDDTPVMTKRIFGVVNRYDLSKEFPILTLRRTPIKTCFREIDWIYRQKSNNINDLNAKIWNEWADEDGSIGKAYGYQINKPVYGYDSQIDYILGELKKNPTSRRLVIEMWNVNELHEMNLPPCAHHLQFVVKNGKLNLILKQRSNDFLVANNFNVVEYSLLMHMVAIDCNLEVGELVHIIGDMHIYNKHEEQAQILLDRVPFHAPRLIVNKKSFYEFTEDDFILEDYNTHPQLRFDVAI